MKRNLLLSISIILLATLSSCSKIGEWTSSRNKHTVTFVAGNDQSRTTVDISGEYAEYSWEDDGETFKVLQGCLLEGDMYDVMTAEATDVTKTGERISFKADLPASPDNFDQYKYLVVYPSHAFSQATSLESIELTLKNPQYPSTSMYDPEADMMVSDITTTTTGIEDSTPISLRFLRLVTIGRMTVRNLAVTEDEVVQSVSIDFAGKELNGEWAYDPATEQLTVVGDGRIDIIYDEGVTLSGSTDTFDVWFACAPFTLLVNDSYTITVTTDKAVYTKTSTKTKGSEMRFGRGNVTSISANFSGIERGAITKASAWSHTFTGKTWDEDDTKFVATQELSGMNWTLALSGEKKYFGYDSTKGVQIGAIGKSSDKMSLTGNFGQLAGVDRVIVNASGASGMEGSISVLVGGRKLHCDDSTLASTNTEYVFESATLLTGDVVIALEQTSAKAFFIKSIHVNQSREDLPISASADKSTITVGDTAVISVPDDKMGGRTITFSSSDDSVATVSDSGTVTGVAAGTATITVTAKENAFYTESSTTVEIAVEQGVLVYDWFLVNSADELGVGDTIIIAAADANFAMSTTQNSSNRGQTEIVKTDDNENIASVSNSVQQITLESGSVAGTLAFNVGNGYLYAASSSGNQLKKQSTIDGNASWLITFSGGTASVVAQGTNTRNTLRYNYNNGNGLFSCYAPASQSAVAIYKKDDHKAKNDLAAGNQTILMNQLPLDLSTIVTGGNGQPITYSVTSGNATITSGSFSTQTPGEYTVSASQPASDTVKAKTVKFTITVNKVPVTGLTMSETTKSIQAGEEFTLTCSTIPADATYQTVTWSSDHTDIASVVDGKVTGIKAGTAVITATSSDDDTMKATCTVTVSSVPVTGISLDITEKSINIGNSFTLTPTILPAVGSEKTVTWSSDNTDVATVDNGVVTGVSAGDCTITATAVGGLTATCAVTVNGVAVTGVTLDKTQQSVAVGSNFTLTPTITPANASNKNVTWSSDNEAVATVADGVVTGVSAGTCTITVTTVDGGLTATCAVTVSATKTAVYTVSSKTSVSTSGDTPSGSSATFANTYTNNAEQMTSGNSMTLTLSGYTGKKITGITLNVHSNSKSGAGGLNVTAGSTTIASLSACTFNLWYDNTSFGTGYRDVHVTLTNAAYTIKTGENVVIVINATANSLYCHSFTITYE